MSHYNNISGLFPIQIQKSFDKDELAYLAITSKPERQLQDKICFALNKELPRKLVIKEWKKHDIAIFDRNSQNIESIVELKSQLGFTMGTPEYIEAMKRDLLKSAQTLNVTAGGEDAEILFIQFGRTLDKTPNGHDPNLVKAFKYLSGAINDCNALPKEPITCQAQFEKFKFDWEGYLNDANIHENNISWIDPIDGGEFLGIGIKIITSIIGPYTTEDVFKLNTHWGITL